jgi:gamma-glutamylcyclotransferase
MKYFAYGSNMLFERLRERVPSAVALGTVKLPEYALVWNKTGKDGSGKCSIVKTSKLQDNVWGVLYEIDPTEKLNLDRVEGLGYGYDEIIVQLEFNGKTVEACTYIATSFNPFLKPFCWYKDFVVYGSRQNNLPKHYISMLETADCIKDPDKKRNRINRNILEKALKQQV